MQRGADIRRGTTPKFIFTLPFDTEIVAKAKVIFKQGDDVVIEKTANECQFDGNRISVQLTQDETLKFNCSISAKVQLRVLTMGGDALSSDVYSVFVGECLDNEVLA